MKTKLLLLLAVVFLAIVDVSQAGGRCGWGGGGWGWGGGRGWCGGGYWGGGPYWGWGGGPYWGWGGWWPSVGVSFVAPVPVYRSVYVTQSAPSYVTYARPSLARAQVRLAKLGYYPGPIDGAFGPMTSQAIRSYQIDYGLPVTGRLDPGTRASLGV
jgi:hypothetical protein